MDDKKRMIETYEVRQSVFLGDREIVFAIDKNAELPYMVSDCKDTGGFGLLYDNALVSNDYLELMEVFTDRLKAQLRQVREERTQRGISADPLTADACLPKSGNGNLDGKVLIISPNALRPEYATADHQLVLATGGNGCRPDARGNAVFCITLYSGNPGRWERYDILGIADPEKLPKWARDAANQFKRHKKREGQER